ncbi:MAG TPA: cell division protein ZapA [Acidobacteriaceae bacterium]|jgi:cell division protein ZapA|nr:cell division protein ZapA [Acidobacteriaceae bacterium]
MPQLAEPIGTEEMFDEPYAAERDEERQLTQQQQRSAAEASRAESMARESGAVVVDIYDQVYQLRGTDPEYIERLAMIVDGKMRAVSARGATVDSLRVAVLAALNIADELLTLRARFESLAGSLNQQQTSVRSRAGSLMGMLDEVLEERKAG